MGYYDDYDDYEAEVVREFERGMLEAEQRRLLSTGMGFECISFKKEQ